MSENNELVIETLNKRLAALEAEVSRLKKTSKGVPEDVLAAICAAVSAYLGNDGKAVSYTHLTLPTNREV